MPRVRTLGSLALGIVASFVAITLWALEGREVVVLRTFDAHGDARQTRTWIADDGGSVLVEAATAGRPFLRDIQVRPGIELQRGGKTVRCHATPLANPGGHQRIRRLLRQKYGWADRWIALLTDTSESVAIQLECGAR